MNNTFLLFYSQKPRNQVRTLINRKWSIQVPKWLRKSWGTEAS